MIVFIRVVKNKIRCHLLGEILQVSPPVGNMPVGRKPQALDLSPESPRPCADGGPARKNHRSLPGIPFSLYLPAQAVPRGSFWSLPHRYLLSVPDHTEQAFDITHPAGRGCITKGRYIFYEYCRSAGGRHPQKIRGDIIMKRKAVILRPEGKDNGPMSVIGLYGPGIAEENEIPFIVHHDIGQVFRAFHHQVVSRSAHQVEILVEQ